MSLRFVFQPLVAVLLGIRDGAMDAKAGEPPFIIDLIIDRGNRKAKVAGVLKSLSKTIIIATVFDMIAQYLIFDQVRVVPASIVRRTRPERPLFFGRAGYKPMLLDNVYKVY